MKSFHTTTTLNLELNSNMQCKLAFLMDGQHTGLLIPNVQCCLDATVHFPVTEF